MTRWSFAACLLLGACGSTSTTPLSASFPLGPAQVLASLATENPDILLGEEPRWPSSAEPMERDVVVVRGVTLDVPSEQAASFAEGQLVLVSSTVTTDLVENPFAGVELFVGGPAATSLDDPSVLLVGRAEVARMSGEARDIVFGDGGETALADALAGRLEGQDAAAPRLSLFLRGRAPVQLRPGETLPLDVDGAVLVDISLRASP